VEPYPEWNEMVFYRWGYARVRAVDAFTLEWEWMSGIDNTRYDKMKITQNLTGDSWVLPAETDTDTDTSSSGDNDDLSTGALVGIYVAAAVGISVLSIGLFVLVMKQLRRESSDENQSLNKNLI
jgi:hypothetical protein